MSAVFKTGPITFNAAEDVKKFRLVTVTATGVKHAAATGAVFGGIVTSATATPPDRTADNVLHIGHPGNVAVHIAPAVIPVEATGDATAIKQGDPVYTAADGKVSATGTVFAGTAVRDGAEGRVKVLLASPSVPA